MCLILVAWKAHPQYELVVAANRDEFYDRPAAALKNWEDHPDVWAGQDVKSSGTWMGSTSTRRFAAITNYRDPTRLLSDAPSRGRIVKDFLIEKTPAERFVSDLEARAAAYNGFNLLAWDGVRLVYFSNRSPLAQTLSPGIYGLSNHLLDTPWPKVGKGKRQFKQALSTAAPELISSLFSILADREVPPDSALPETGVGKAWERVLSPIFITSPIYGTRTSSVVLVSTDGKTKFIEQTYDQGRFQGTVEQAYSSGCATSSMRSASA
ncbi:MAG: NRDE family protein [Myxococcota bacterium]|nr:NRDE family protein [Myxococcota bacterium]